MRSGGKKKTGTDTARILMPDLRLLLTALEGQDAGEETKKNAEKNEAWTQRPHSDLVSVSTKCIKIKMTRTG